MSTFLAGKPGLIDLDPSIPRPSVLADRVYQALKHRILTCALKPGDRLVEIDLCNALNVSRTPLREAFNRLAHEGLVNASPYRGYTVAPLSAESFQDLCEVRRLIEPQVAALAAQRASPEDTAKLLNLSKLEYVVGDRASYEAYLRANSMFHLEIARCARNSQLESIVVAVLDRHQRPCYLGLDVGIDAAESTVEHVEVVNAIRDRNSAKASELMAKHIAGGERRILAALRAAGY
jgi:GntR family transcriptional regulator, rspAB operon transcriptional repressor